jgi:hypothetical protein
MVNAPDPFLEEDGKAGAPNGAPAAPDTRQAGDTAAKKPATAAEAPDMVPYFSLFR